MKKIPYSLISENKIIAAIIFNNELFHEIYGQLSPSHFHNQSNKNIYQVLIDFFNSRKPFDLDVLVEYTKNNNIPIDPIQWLSWQEEITFEPQPYVETVLKESKLRSLVKSAHDLWSKAQEANTDEKDYDQIFHDFEKILHAKTDQTMLSPKSMTQISHEYVQAATQVRGHETIKTGFHQLDYKLGGLRRGHFIVLAGMPSHGKTAFALNIARNVAIQGKNVGILSLEQPFKELYARFLAQQSGFICNKLLEEEYFKQHMVDLYPHLQALNELPIFIEDFSTTNKTINTVKSCARIMKKKHGVDLIVLDYLGRIAPSNKRDNKVNEVADISNELKSLAQELDIPLLTICAINRENIKRADPRPRGSDLRDSGTIEFDADEILLSYYAYKINPETGDKNKIEIIIDKQRNGELGIMDFHYDGPSMKFENIDADMY